LKRPEDLEIAKRLLAKYRERIALPTDVAVDAKGKREDIAVEELPSEYLIKDIGEETRKKFCRSIATAKTIVMNGPVGVYEEKGFERGTREVLRAIAKSRAFSVIGGGHTLAALKKFGMRNEDFGYVCLAGKALIEHLSGVELPGVKVLA